MKSCLVSYFTVFNFGFQFSSRCLQTLMIMFVQCQYKLQIIAISSYQISYVNFNLSLLYQYLPPFAHILPASIAVRKLFEAKRRKQRAWLWGRGCGKSQIKIMLSENSEPSVQDDYFVKKSLIPFFDSIPGIQSPDKRALFSVKRATLTLYFSEARRSNWKV